MSLHTEYRFEELPLLIANVEVGLFTGTASILIDNGWTRVEELTFEGTKRVAKEPFGTKWPEDAKVSIARDDYRSELERLLFEALSAQIEERDFTGDEVSSAYVSNGRSQSPLNYNARRDAL